MKKLREHMITKHEAAQIPCDLCDFVGETRNEYQKHVEKKHPVQTQTQSNDSTSKENNGKKKDH